MRPLLLAVVLFAVGCSSGGGGSSTASTPEAPPTPKFTNIVLTDDESSKAPKTEFGKDTAKLTVFFDFENVPSGSKLNGVWICEKAPDLDIPPDFKIDEASVDVGMLTNTGNFSLSKPTNGWPAGDYRVELQIDGKTVETVKFKIGK